MFAQAIAASIIAVVAVIPIEAQARKGANNITYDVTVTAEGKPYTGTMELAVAAGKVTGSMHITAPTEITGKAAGASKGSQMTLAFPYRMVERACDGQIAMVIMLPQKKGAATATGTVEITGCGRPEGDKLPGTIELKPRAPKK